MKTTLTTLLLLVVFFLGCTDTPISPVKGDNHSYQLIKLPPKAGLTVETLVTQYKDIDGDNGGNFEANFSYQGGPSGLVTVKSKLDFKADAFEGERLISQTLDTDFAAMTFGPSMQFNAQVKLDLRIEGLDLSGVDPNTLDFVYVNEDGTIEHVEYDDIIMNVSTGTIEVDDAELTHFSRYGFVN